MKIKGQKTNEEIMFYLCLVDILFFPYLKPVSFPLSYLIMLVWYTCGGYLKVTRFKDTGHVIIFSLFAIASTVIAPFFAEKTSFATDIKRCLQYMMCFLGFLFFEYIFTFYKIKIKSFFIFFVFIVLLYAIFYLIDPHLYASIKTVVYPADNHTRRYLLNLVSYRFNYIIADPNNVGYILDGIFTFLLFHEKTNSLILVGLFASQLLILLTTQSIGACAVFIMVILFYVYCSIFNILKNKRLFLKTMTIVTFLFFTALIVLIIPAILNSVTFKEFLSRTMVYRNLGDSSGGRMGDFFNGLKHFTFMNLFIGIGEEQFVSEIGHWYLIYMYGGIAYLLFLYMVFRKNKRSSWREYVALFPFFVGFSMNIAIVEQKFLLIMLLIVALLRSESERREFKSDLIAWKEF